jgi:17beta-estradiol 17-dehydrogenase / very-long-chain 3-oxoacyl-CoA reductase
MFAYIFNDLKFSIYMIIKIIFCFLTLKFANFIYKNFIRKRHDLIERYGKGSWAVVTGATDGIGKAICHELAKSGFNIILVSRTILKLKTVAEDLCQKYDIKTHIIQFDFNAQTKTEEYLQTFGPLNMNYDISILVNNVGSDHHDSFKAITLEDVAQEVNVNVIPLAMLTKLLFADMDKRTERSAIINMSSFAAEFPFPMKCIYSATKAFDHFFTIALRAEYIYGKVDFLSVKPLEVGTPMTGNEPDGIVVLKPEQVASAIFNDLGHEEETIGHWLHKIQGYIILLVPRFIINAFMRKYWYDLVLKNSTLKKNK